VKQSDADGVDGKQLQSWPTFSSSPSTRAMDDEQRQQDDWARSRKNRLPSFTEVLSRRTRPPVDLFMF
jgi:hypothetical protein